jgi:alpha-glucoside transport system substrate-binding protein
MLQQASFYAAQWPSFKKDVKIAEDGDVFAFYLPGDGLDGEGPVEGGGEFVTAFADRPEVQSVQTFLSRPDFASAGQAGRVGLGQQRRRPEPVHHPIDKLSAQYLTDPTRPSASTPPTSCRPPSAPGAEWKQLTAWFARTRTTQAVLDAIDAAWPALIDRSPLPSRLCAGEVVVTTAGARE